MNLCCKNKFFIKIAIKNAAEDWLVLSSTAFLQLKSLFLFAISSG
jgi:hypothetical protein